MCEIEKGVKLKDHPQKVYPFRDMEVGDSFYFEADAEQAKKLRSASANVTSRNGWKFSTLKDGSGYRCWRLK
jgi:hypothetical protein